MASLVKQNGYYYAQFYDQNRAPRRKKIPLKVRRKQKARSLLVRLEEAWAAGAGDWDPWRDGRRHEIFGWKDGDAEADLSRLGDAKEAYLASCSHLKANTLRTYREIVGPFTRFMGAGFPVGKLRPRHVLEWLDSTKAGDVTRQKYNSHLGYLFRFLVRRGWMEADLSKEVPLRKVPEQAPKAMSEEEVEALVAAIHVHTERYAENWRVPDYTWLAEIVRANVRLGLRRAEFIHLEWEHVSLDRRTLQVKNTEAFTTKSGAERPLPLCSEAVKILRRRQGIGARYVFTSHRGGKIKPDYLSRTFMKFRRRAGLPEHFSFHSTRHTCLTWLAESAACR